MRFFEILSSGLFFVSTTSSLLIVLSTFIFGISHPAPILVLTVWGLGTLFPRLACCLALVALPFGGNRPGTEHAFYSILVGAALFLGLMCNGLLRKQPRVAQLERMELSNPLLFTGCLYCFFSICSLAALPFNHVLADVKNVVDRRSMSELAFSTIALLRSNEHTLIYSLVSVYLTVLAYTLGVFVFRLCKEKAAITPRLFIGSISIGLFVSLVLGLLDYYHFINLRSFRDLDPLVNPGNSQFRLQSLFAHSGWYAEYVTLSVPTCLLVLTFRAPFWARAALILFLLALGEFALILTYQRGGWLSYPITLFTVWAAIYVVRCLEQRRMDVMSALRRSIGKVLISLPITVIASLALVTVIQGRASVEKTLSPYVSRFKDIQRTGDRSNFFFAGMLIGLRHPILGGGSDSFAWQFEREFESPEGTFAGRYTLPLHGSAHNVFAQTFSGKGLFGLLTLLALPIFLVIGARRVVNKTDESISTKLIALSGACFGCAFLVYGNVQEVFYVQALQFLFFAMVAIIASVTFKSATSQFLKPLLNPAWCVAIVALHLVWEFVLPGTTRTFYQELRPFGCFAPEQTPSGVPFRWCGEHALLLKQVPLDHSPITVTLEAGPTPQHVTIQTSQVSPLTESLNPGEIKTISIPVDPLWVTGSFVPVYIDAAHSFVPSRKSPGSDDSRRLAFKIREARMQH